MPPLTGSLLSRSTTGSGSSSSTRISAAAAAAISKPAAGAAPSSSPPPARPSPSPTPRPKPASPFASGLSGRLFGGHRAAARSSSSAAAVFERRFASAATRNSYDEILTSLAKPGGGTEFGKYYSLPALSDPRIDRLPYSIRILLESAIRNCDEFQVTGKDVEKIID